MILNEILEHNKALAQEIKEKEEQISELRAQIDNMKFVTIAPCQFCPYDGVYRCETCKENCFEGFNIKDYPRYE